LHIVILPLLTQNQLTTAKPLVMPYKIVIALKAFATIHALELFSMDVHVSSVHFFVFEHQTALFTRVSLGVLVIGGGDDGRLHGRDGVGLNHVVLLDAEVHDGLGILEVGCVDGDRVHVSIDPRHVAHRELDIVDQMGEIAIHC